MLHRLRKQALRLDLDGSLGVVERSELHPHRAVDYPLVAGIAQAPLLYLPLSLPAQDFGVDVDVGLLFFGKLNDYQSSELPDLVGGQSDAARFAHGLHHVLGQLKQLLIDAADFSGPLPQYRIGYFEYLSNSHLHTSADSKNGVSPCPNLNPRMRIISVCRD